jgi:hypothetical protein
MAAYQDKNNKTGEIEIISQGDRADTITRMDEGTFTSVLLCHMGMRKSIIFNLVKRDIPFSEISYGAGVYRIIKEDSLKK